MAGKSLQHVGVLGMHWVHRSGGSGGGGSLTGRQRAGARRSAIALAEQRNVLRSKRSTGTKIADFFLTDYDSSKLFSEAHGKSEFSKKGAKLSDKLATIRKSRDKTTKVIDALMTPGTSGKLFSEMKPEKRRRITLFTAGILAGGLGALAIATH